MEGNEFIEFDWTLVRAIWLLVYLMFDATKIPMIDSYHAFLWQPKFELNCVKTIVFVWQGHVNVNHTRKTALQTTQNTNIDSPNFPISSTSDWGPNCARARWYEKKQNCNWYSRSVRFVSCGDRWCLSLSCFWSSRIRLCLRTCRYVSKQFYRAWYFEMSLWIVIFVVMLSFYLVVRVSIFLPIRRFFCSCEESHRQLVWGWFDNQECLEVFQFV